MHTPASRALPAVLVFVAACSAAQPQAAADPGRAGAQDGPLIARELTTGEEIARALRENYTKYEYRIPMRDGVHLFTVAYVPKDHARTYPVMLTRTPYSVGPYGVDNYPDGKDGGVSRIAPSPLFVREGYILVAQDVRGRMMSEGQFVDVRPHATKGGVDESTDAYDAIDYLVKNLPANNGRVGTWGISYPGFYAAQSAVDAHPALKAVSPQAPVTEWFLGDDWHHNGAFLLAQAFNFYAGFGKPRPAPTTKSTWGYDYDTADAYDFFLGLGPIGGANANHFKRDIAFWNDLEAHGTRDDFWKARDPRPYYRNVKPAVMVVGGWFDAEDLWGALATYHAFDGQSPRADVSLVMGPWRHGGWSRGDGDRLGDVSFGAKTSKFYQQTIEFAFFQKHLKGKQDKGAEAWAFETGTNTWERYDAWPPKSARPVTLFFGERGQLSPAAPGAAPASSSPSPAPVGETRDFDAWVSDPQKPVPYRANLSSTVDPNFMSDDQRFASRRPDVVVYATPALAQDLTLAGPVEADLWVSTTGTDSDFIVKVVDVYPQNVQDPDPNPTGVRMGGYQQLVRGEVMRGKFRTSFERPEPFTPGAPTHVRFTLPDVNHTFRPGHKLMVQVQSSWFPLVDRNPQTFVDIYHATAGDFRAATQKVFHSQAYPSGIRVLVAKGALP